ncbi:hypothetical protein SDC9_118626 [bioreactor metagenome]|uniref:Uncharacterized protein n=1 Tax=bioreactor metagenome TaxID=1076179 RepID=A0A645C369_9ZZZZ
MNKHSVRQGIVIANDTIRQFIDPIIGIKTFSLNPVINHFSEKVHSRSVCMILRITIKSFGNSIMPGHSRKIPLIPNFARFFNRE